MDGYKRQGFLLKALAHPARLRIMDVLIRDEECCVCHLENILGKRQAYISQQLSRLREAGLVVDRRIGLNVFYSLAEESIVELLTAARNSANDLADLKGEELIFHQLEQDETPPCICPKCTAGVENSAGRDSE